MASGISDGRLWEQLLSWKPELSEVNSKQTQLAKNRLHEQLIGGRAVVCIEDLEMAFNSIEQRCISRIYQLKDILGKIHTQVPAMKVIPDDLNIKSCASDSDPEQCDDGKVPNSLVPLPPELDNTSKTVFSNVNYDLEESSIASPRKVKKYGVKKNVVYSCEEEDICTKESFDSLDIQIPRLFLQGRRHKLFLSNKLSEIAFDDLAKEAKLKASQKMQDVAVQKIKENKKRRPTVETFSSTVYNQSSSDANENSQLLRGIIPGNEPEDDETWKAAQAIECINNNVLDNLDTVNDCNSKLRRVSQSSLLSRAPTSKKRKSTKSERSQPAKRRRTSMANDLPLDVKPAKSNLAQYVENFANDCGMYGSATPGGLSIASQPLVSSTTHAYDFTGQQDNSTVMCYFEGDWVNGGPCQLITNNGVSVNESQILTGITNETSFHFNGDPKNGSLGLPVSIPLSNFDFTNLSHSTPIVQKSDISNINYSQPVINIQIPSLPLAMQTSLDDFNGIHPPVPAHTMSNSVLDLSAKFKSPGASSTLTNINTCQIVMVDVIGDGSHDSSAPLDLSAATQNVEENIKSANVANELVATMAESQYTQEVGNDSYIEFARCLKELDFEGSGHKPHRGKDMPLLEVENEKGDVVLIKDSANLSVDSNYVTMHGDNADTDLVGQQFNFDTQSHKEEILGYLLRTYTDEHNNEIRESNISFPELDNGGFDYNEVQDFMFRVPDGDQIDGQNMTKDDQQGQNDINQEEFLNISLNIEDSKNVHSKVADKCETIVGNKECSEELEKQNTESGGRNEYKILVPHFAVINVSGAEKTTIIGQLDLVNKSSVSHDILDNNKKNYEQTIKNNNQQNDEEQKDNVNDLLPISNTCDKAINVAEIDDSTFSHAVNLKQTLKEHNFDNFIKQLKKNVSKEEEGIFNNNENNQYSADNCASNATLSDRHPFVQTCTDLNEKSLDKGQCDRQKSHTVNFKQRLKEHNLDNFITELKKNHVSKEKEGSGTAPANFNNNENKQYSAANLSDRHPCVKTCTDLNEKSLDNGQCKRQESIAPYESQYQKSAKSINLVCSNATKDNLSSAYTISNKEAVKNKIKTEFNDADIFRNSNDCANSAVQQAHLDKTPQTSSGKIVFSVKKVTLSQENNFLDLTFNNCESTANQVPPSESNLPENCDYFFNDNNKTMAIQVDTKGLNINMKKAVGITDKQVYEEYMKYNSLGAVNTSRVSVKEVPEHNKSIIFNTSKGLEGKFSDEIMDTDDIDQKYTTRDAVIKSELTCDPFNNENKPLHKRSAKKGLLVKDSADSMYDKDIKKEANAKSATYFKSFLVSASKADSYETNMSLLELECKLEEENLDYDEDLDDAISLEASSVCSLTDNFFTDSVVHESNISNSNNNIDFLPSQNVTIANNAKPIPAAESSSRNLKNFKISELKKPFSAELNTQDDGPYNLMTNTSIADINHLPSQPSLELEKISIEQESSIIASKEVDGWANYRNKILGYEKLTRTIKNENVQNTAYDSVNPYQSIINKEGIADINHLTMQPSAKLEKISIEQESGSIIPPNDGDENKVLRYEKLKRTIENENVENTAYNSVNPYPSVTNMEGIADINHLALQPSDKLEKISIKQEGDSIIALNDGHGCRTYKNEVLGCENFTRMIKNENVQNAANNIVNLSPQMSQVQQNVPQGGLTCNYRSGDRSANIKNIFGITCLPHLVDHCLRMPHCPESHQYKDNESVSSSLNSLNASHLMEAYSFMYNHEKLFKSYFNLFCQLYTIRLDVNKLLCMAIDCERYPQYSQYLISVYESLVECGITRVNACTHILNRAREKSSAFVEALVAIIMRSDWTTFVDHIEGFARAEHNFHFATLEQMSQAVLDSNNQRLKQVFGICVQMLHSDDTAQFIASPKVLQWVNLFINPKF